jgi:membrane associated rhomboid family serine protease
MKLSLRNALIATIVVVVVAFLTAGIAGNHQSGARGTIGDVAWTVALLGALVVIGLAIATLVQSTRRRSKQRSGT